MPPRAWLSCTAVSRLIGVPDDRRIRARLDYLVRDGKLERKRDRGVHGPVYLFRIIRVEGSSVQYRAKVDTETPQAATIKLR
jgi:hypothetical protein